MTWEKVLEYGYGLLNMSPDTFYSTEFGDFLDMVEAKLSFNMHKQDEDLEWMAWFIANVMLSSGNMKKGTKADKLSKSLYLPYEYRLKEWEKEQKKKTPVGEKEVNKQREELMKKFNLQQ